MVTSSWLCSLSSSLHSMCHHHPLTASSAGERLIPCSCLCLLYPGSVCVCVCVCVCVRACVRARACVRKFSRLRLWFLFPPSAVKQNPSEGTQSISTKPHNKLTVSFHLCLLLFVYKHVYIYLDVGFTLYFCYI